MESILIIGIPFAVLLILVYIYEARLDREADREWDEHNRQYEQDDE